MEVVGRIGCTVGVAPEGLPPDWIVYVVIAPREMRSVVATAACLTYPVKGENSIGLQSILTHEDVF